MWAKLDSCIWLLQEDKSKRVVNTAEAFGEGRKGQKAPDCAGSRSFLMGQAGSYLSQVAFSGGAVDQLANGSASGWVVSGGRLRVLWCSPGGCMEGRVYGVS